MHQGVRRSSRSNKGTNRYLQDQMRAELEYLKAKNGVTTLEEKSDTEQSTVRCLVCGTTDDNYDEDNDPYGDMIQCDRCDTWQHIKCMTGKDALQTPSKYYCNFCDPAAYPDLECVIDPQEVRNNTKAKKETQDEDLQDYTDEEGFKADEKDVSWQTGAIKRKKHAEPRRKTKIIKTSQESKLRESALKMFSDLFSKYIIPDTVKNGTLELSKQDLGEDEIQNLAKELEEELFKASYNHDEGKLSNFYTEKVRVIFSNLKDRKNLRLKELVVTKTLPFDKLVRMSVNELINPDLQEFRENVGNKAWDQLIVEQPDKPKYFKTHKGEELIEDPNAFEPEDIIFSKDIIASKHDAESNTPKTNQVSIEENAGDPTKSPVKRSDSTRPDSEKPDIPKCTIEYQEINNKFMGNLKFLGSSQVVSEEVYNNAMGGSILAVEGRLNSAEANKYLQQMSSSRVFLAYQLLPNKSESNLQKFTELFDFLSQRQRYGALETKRAYVRHIYVIPCEDGKRPEVFTLIPTIEELIEKEARILLVLAVVRTDLLDGKSR